MVHTAVHMNFIRIHDQKMFNKKNLIPPGQVREVNKPNTERLLHTVVYMCISRTFFVPSNMLELRPSSG